jgi:hypothetical protein
MYLRLPFQASSCGSTNGNWGLLITIRPLFANPVKHRGALGIAPEEKFG